eukprot:SAG31_NODE_1325_length_8781_cov_5.940221_2_plen_334_part_00
MSPFIVTAELGCKTVGELAAVPLPTLVKTFGEKDGRWLARMAVGDDDEPVKDRVLPKSIGCGKTFSQDRWANSDTTTRQWMLTKMDEVQHWLGQLAAECYGRLAEDRLRHGRVPKLLTVSIGSKSAKSISRSTRLRGGSAAMLAEDALTLVRIWAREEDKGAIILHCIRVPPGANLANLEVPCADASQRADERKPRFEITSLYLVASEFEDIGIGGGIVKFMRPTAANPSTSSQTTDQNLADSELQENEDAPSLEPKPTPLATDEACATATTGEGATEAVGQVAKPAELLASPMPTLETCDYDTRQYLLAQANKIDRTVFFGCANNINPLLMR